MKGIDVSYANGKVDWEAVAAAGYKFAIVRCTYGRHGVDDNFLENVNGAHAAGLRVGAYHYSYALNVEEAIEEALQDLKPKEQEVLRLRFGLNDGRDRTLDEIGKQFGVTRERIRQIEAKALKKLRSPKHRKKLQGYDID